MAKIRNDAPKQTGMVSSRRRTTKRPMTLLFVDTACRRRRDRVSSCADDPVTRLLAAGQDAVG